MPMEESLMGALGSEVYGGSSGLELPLLNPHIQGGAFYGSNGEWYAPGLEPHYDGIMDGHGAGFHNLQEPVGSAHFPNGYHSSQMQTPAVKPKKRSWHKTLREAIQLSEDVSDLLISFAPIGYAAAFLGIIGHGVYEIYSGNVAQGTAELAVDGIAFATTVSKVRSWYKDELTGRKTRTISKRMNVDESAVKEVTGNDPNVLDNLLGQTAHEKFRAFENASGE